MAHRQQRRKLQSCDACRTAHARCDVQVPTCGRCTLLDTVCVRDKPIPFRYSNVLAGEDDRGSTARSTRSSRAAAAVRRREASKADFGFADDQVWLTPPPGNVEFVFEYEPGLAASQDEDGSDEDDEDEDESEVSTPPPLRPPGLAPLSPQSQSPPRVPFVEEDVIDVSVPAVVTPPIQLQTLPHGSHIGDESTPDDCLWLSGHDPNHSQSHSGPSPATSNSPAGYSSRSVSFILTPSVPPANPVSPHHLLQKQWPFENDYEAILLRHFVTDLSSWFDYGDPQNTFATSVAQCAASSPPLLNAIFAVSSRHMGLVKGDDDGDASALAENYHRTCLKLLIPLLNDTNAALDERLYAATVILRLYEEILGQDMENHLMGTHTFVRLHEYAQSSPIRQAVFRVAIRQEIVISFRTQRPVQLLREYVRADHSLRHSLRTASSPSPSSSSGGGGEDDWALAFHIFVLCAEVLTFCYGEEGDAPVALSSELGPSTPPPTWDDLNWRSQQWFNTLPVSYQPLLYRPSGPGRVFPTIMLLNDCHVAARQHYLLTQILLAAHDPRRPHLGPRATESTKATNTAIKDHVRGLCGIALSNKHCVPSMFTACIAIAICGDLFTDLVEQQALFDILVTTDRELAWPTVAVQAHLREQWGWT